MWHDKRRGKTSGVRTQSTTISHVSPQIVNSRTISIGSGTEDSSDDHESDKPNTVMIVVLVLCIVAGIIAISLLVLFFRKRRWVRYWKAKTRVTIYLQSSEIITSKLFRISTLCAVVHIVYHSSMA